MKCDRVQPRPVVTLERRRCLLGIRRCQCLEIINRPTPGVTQKIGGRSLREMVRTVGDRAGFGVRYRGVARSRTTETTTTAATPIATTSRSWRPATRWRTGKTVGITVVLRGDSRSINFNDCDAACVRIAFRRYEQKNK